MILEKSLYNIKPTSWKKTYASWKKNEDNAFWRAHYTKKGFSSWKKWRQTLYIQPLGLSKLSWQIGELMNNRDILKFHGGPFKGWKKKFYKKKSSLSFQQLSLLPEIKNNQRFKKLVNNFPKQTTLIVIIKNKEIIVIEGMHRSTALALLINKKIKVKTKINIIFAKYNKKIPLLGKLA